MVYASTRRDSQGCSTRQRRERWQEQCKQSRPQEPCSHGLSRPVAAGAPAGQHRVRVHTPQSSPSPSQSDGVTPGFSPGPPQRPKQKRPPHVPFLSAKRAPGAAQTPPTPNYQTNPPRPNRLKSNHLRRQCPSAAPNHCRPLPGEKSQSPWTFWDISPDQRRQQANGKRRMAGFRLRQRVPGPILRWQVAASAAGSNRQLGSFHHPREPHR